MKPIPTENFLTILAALAFFTAFFGTVGRRIYDSQIKEEVVKLDPAVRNGRLLTSITLAISTCLTAAIFFTLIWISSRS